MTFALITQGGIMSEEQNEKKDWEYFRKMEIKHEDTSELKDGHILKYILVTFLLGLVSSVIIAIIYWLLAIGVGFKFSLTLGLIGFSTSYFARQIVKVYGVKIIIISIMFSLFFCLSTLMFIALVNIKITFQYSIDELLQNVALIDVFNTMLANLSRTDGFGLILAIILPISFLKRDPIF